MKAGILTFHRAYNFGALLQAYALQYKLREIGVQSEVIDYLSIEKRGQIKLFSYDFKTGVKTNLIKLVKDIYRVKKNRSFDRFMSEEMCISIKKYSRQNELEQMDRENVYDVYVVGSDQVWNYKNNLGDPAFLLTFVGENSKKCSYAASFGNSKLDQEMYTMYKTELDKFRILTVREESALDEYPFLRDKGAKVVLDPTLLLSKDIYRDIANPRIPKSKYAFVYTIARDRNLRRMAKKYCQERNLILVDCKKSLLFFENSSPRDFLSFIQYAESVFTNSFHGTAFSIIMEKPFYTEVQTKTSLNNRSNDLLNKLGLANRDIDSAEFSIENEINYEEIRYKLEELRDNSMEVLKRIVGM